MSGQNVLITGASSGLGAALANIYAKQGCTLYLTGRNKERLHQVVQACKSHNVYVRYRVMDVCDQEALRSWINACDEKTPLDIVIANAGISAGSSGHIESDEQVRLLIDVNVMGVINTIHPAIARMQERQRGHIVVISSLASFRGMPGCPAYSMSKGAIRMYAEALRGCLYQEHIDVSVVTPGYIDTPLTKHNSFPMPFLMDADKAAAYIAKRLVKKPARIAFPKTMYFLSWLLGSLPPGLTDHLYRRLPGKSDMTLKSE